MKQLSPSPEAAAAALGLTLSELRRRRFQLAPQKSRWIGGTHALFAPEKPSPKRPA